MTKAELLIDIVNSYQFVDAIVDGPYLEATNPNGDNLYRINLRIVSGKKVAYVNHYFYVIDEGLGVKEMAYYKDTEPTDVTASVTPGSFSTE